VRTVRSPSVCSSEWFRRAASAGVSVGRRVNRARPPGGAGRRTASRRRRGCRPHPKRPARTAGDLPTALLDLQARNLDDTINRATTLVVDAGGYVFSESASLTSAQHAHVVFKVPPDRFADVIAHIGRLGTLVHRNIGTQDVTGRVVDLDARLHAAQTSADRLRELLANSGGVGDLLNVESQLTSREGQVDTIAVSCAARQVDMATVTLDLSRWRRRGRRPVEAPAGFRGAQRRFARSPRLPGDRGDVRRAAAVPADRLLVLGLWWLARRRRPMSALPDALARSAGSLSSPFQSPPPSADPSGTRQRTVREKGQGMARAASAWCGRCRSIRRS
jgi:hypothetical protein